MTWGGWFDDLSGLEKYQYEVYEMYSINESRWLKEQKSVDKPTDILLNNTQVENSHNHKNLMEKNM